MKIILIKKKAWIEKRALLGFATGFLEKHLNIMIPSGELPSRHKSRLLLLQKSKDPILWSQGHYDKLMVVNTKWAWGLKVAHICIRGVPPSSHIMSFRPMSLRNVSSMTHILMWNAEINVCQFLQSKAKKSASK